MKWGGVSWNTSMNHKKGIQAQFICNNCGRKYKMEWAKNNHEKLCKERTKKDNLPINSYRAEY